MENFMKYCPTCQQPNNDQAKFCTKCGTPLPDFNGHWNAQYPNPNPIPNQQPAGPAGFNGSGQPPYSQWQEMQSPVQPQTFYQSAPPQKKKNGGMIALIVILILALVGASGFAGWYFFLRSDFSSSETSSQLISSAASSSESEEEHALLAPVPSHSTQEENSSSSAPSAPQSNSAQVQTPAVNPSIPEAYSTASSEPQTQRYRLNYVMKIRNGPSLTHSQVGRLTDGNIISVYNEVRADDGSRWGQIAPDQWICLSDADYTYCSPVS